MIEKLKSWIKSLFQRKSKEEVILPKLTEEPQIKEKKIADISELFINSSEEPQIKEKKITNISELFINSSEYETWKKLLLNSSVSKMDADIRENIYNNLFIHLNEIKKKRGEYPGYNNISLLSDTYFRASIISYVRSFAGFLTIERNMDQPTALLWYIDPFGITDKQKENLGISNFYISQELSVDSYIYTIATGKKLIPGSVKLNLVHAIDPVKVIEVKDDGEGNLLAGPGILTGNNNVENNINYQTGLIKFKIGDAFIIEPGDSFSIVARVEDEGINSNNRIKMDMKYVQVVSEPKMIALETNLMTISVMLKSLNGKPQELISNELTEYYIKAINENIVNCIKSMWKEDDITYLIDTKKIIKESLDDSSKLCAFQSELTKIDKELTKRSSIKGVRSTAYIVGENIANWFKNLVRIGEFVNNTVEDYPNNLIGWYRGIPVLTHVDIEDNEGFVFHKTVDGMIAPLIRGIYLPLTNTPVVGDYNNPTQLSSGVCYQEDVVPITSKLIQKFSINGYIE